MIYIKSVIRYSFFLLFLLSIISCNKKELTTDKLIETIVRDSLGYKDNYKSIIVFQEKGCINCQYKTLEFIKQNQNNKEYLFIIQSNGELVDLSSIKKENSNIIFDYKKYLYNYNITNGSAAIIFNGVKVDTILKFDDPYELNKNIKLVKSHL